VILDSVGMFDAAAAFPEQLEIAGAAASAALESASLPRIEEISEVVLLGVGTSGQVGSILREVAAASSVVPIITHNSYGVPSFVGPRTLAIAISCSGDSEETLDAARSAQAVGAQLFTVSGGGALGRFAGDNDILCLDVIPEAPVRRAALGSMLVPAWLALGAIGCVPDATDALAAAISQTRHRRDELITPDNGARRMARRLGRAFPIIYGGEGLGGVAAERWKTQFNDNAKVAAFHNSVPELTHNEVCGWGQDGDVTRQIFQLFLLRHDFEHPQVSRRLDVIDDILDEVVGAVHGVVAEGEGRLAQVLDLMLVGDFLSLHAAVEQGIDPGPVPILAEIESRVRPR